jgi:hypothetical protein
MNFTQPQIAVLIGFCLSLGLQLPPTLPKWNGADVASFVAGKDLAKATVAAQGVHRA